MLCNCPTILTPGPSRALMADEITYGLLASSVILLTIGQAVQKIAVDRVAAGTLGRGTLMLLFKHPAIWIALLCLGASMAIWLAVLYRIDVSKAFPFVSLGQVLVLLASKFYFSEHVSVTRWAGVVLIVIGTALIAQT
jgi:drug/metabolite transporter (DMT)-like permease